MSSTHWIRITFRPKCAHNAQVQMDSCWCFFGFYYTKKTLYKRSIYEFSCPPLYVMLKARIQLLSVKIHLQFMLYKRFIRVFFIKSIECAFIEFFGLWVSNLAVEMLIRDFLFRSNNVGLRGVFCWVVIENVGKGSITPKAAYSHNLAKSITHCYHVEHISMNQIYIWFYGWHLPRWLITSLTLLTPTCVTYFYAVDQMKSANSKAFHLTSKIIETKLDR